MRYETNYRMQQKDIMEPHREWDFEHCGYCRSFMGIKANSCPHCGTERSFADRNLAREVIDFRQRQVIRYDVFYGKREFVKPQLQSDPALSLGLCSLIFLVLQYAITVWINGEYTFLGALFGMVLSLIPLGIIMYLIVALDRWHTNSVNGGPTPVVPPYDPETLDLIVPSSI